MKTYQFISSLFLLAIHLGCRSFAAESSLKSEYDTIDSPFVDTFSEVKTGDLSSIDPLIPSYVSDSIDVENGRGYYAHILDPQDISSEYRALRDALGSIPDNELQDSELRHLRSGLLQKLDTAIEAFSQLNNPVIRFYAPFFSVAVAPGAVTVTNISFGAYIVHMDLGIQTIALDPLELPPVPLDHHGNFFNKGLIWCKRQACKTANAFRGPRKVVGVTTGLSVGNSLLAKGSVAINWSAGKHGIGSIGRGKTRLELGLTTMAGLVSYTGYVTFDQGKPRLILPVGLNLNADSAALFHRAFDIIVATKLGVDANPLSIHRGFYFGMKEDGKMAVVPALEAFRPGTPNGFISKEYGGVKIMGKKPNGELEMTVIAKNPSCTH